MQSYIEVDNEDIYTLRINCKGKKTVGKANKGINVKKYYWFKKLKIKIIKKRKEKKNRTKKKRKHPKNCKARCGGRGL